MAERFLIVCGVDQRVVHMEPSAAFHGSGFFMEGGTTYAAQYEGHMVDLLVTRPCSSDRFEEAASAAIEDGGVITVTRCQWETARRTEGWPEMVALLRQDWDYLAKVLGAVRGAPKCERRLLDARRRRVEFVFANPGRVIGQEGWRIRRFREVATACGWDLRVSDGGRRAQEQAEFERALLRDSALLEKWGEEIDLLQEEYGFPEARRAEVARALEELGFEEVLALMDQPSDLFARSTRKMGVSGLYRGSKRKR